MILTDSSLQVVAVITLLAAAAMPMLLWLHRSRRRRATPYAGAAVGAAIGLVAGGLEGAPAIDVVLLSAALGINFCWPLFLLRLRADRDARGC